MQSHQSQSVGVDSMHQQNENIHGSMNRRKQQQHLKDSLRKQNYLPHHMRRPPVGQSQQNMAQKVQNANITYRDQKEIMRNIFG